MGKHVLLRFILPFMFTYSLQASDFKYIGCYVSPKQDALYVNTTYMSSEECIHFCIKQRFPLAIISVFAVPTELPDTVEGICTCGNESVIKRINDSSCNFTCLNEKCVGTSATIYYVYNVDITEIQSERGNDKIIVGVIAGALLISVCVIVAVIIYRRRQLNQFHVVKSKDFKEIDDRIKKPKNDEIQSGKNTKPNDYTEQNREPVLHPSEEPLIESKTQYENNDIGAMEVLYVNETDKEYENVFINSVKTKKSNPKRTTAEKNMEKSKVPVSFISDKENPDKQLYLSMGIPNDSNIIEQINEEKGEEYEEMALKSSVNNIK